MDDDQDLTNALSLRLRAAGFETFTADCSDEASRIALRERPNVIILDVDMPACPGLEFQECLKFAERGRNIPIVFLSGQDSQANRLTAFQQGASAFITKPFEWTSLLSTLRSVIAGGCKTDARQ